MIPGRIESTRELNKSSELNTFLELKTAEQNEMFGVLTQEEELQKAAFEALLMQKDSRHSRVTNQINLIEKELTQLTRVEKERKELKIEMEMTMIAEKRFALTEMLIQLIAERDKRENQLKQRLEYLLEIPVLKILEQAEARDYVPLFARHRITLEVLCNMTEADLRQAIIVDLSKIRMVSVIL